MKGTVGPLAALLVAAAVAGGCGILGPGEERVLGVIESYGEPLVVEAPDTVVAGAEFVVMVRTYGGGCTSKGPTSVDVSGNTATVVPWDRESGANVCTLILKYFRHTAAVRFGTPGDAVLIIRGRKEPGGELVERERTIHVR